MLLWSELYDGDLPHMTFNRRNNLRMSPEDVPLERGHDEIAIPIETLRSNVSSRALSKNKLLQLGLSIKQTAEGLVCETRRQEEN